MKIIRGVSVDKHPQLAMKSFIPLFSFPFQCVSLCAVCACLHLCVHTCGGLHMCVCAGARACGGPACMSGIILYCSSTLFTKADYSLNQTQRLPTWLISLSSSLWGSSLSTFLSWNSRQLPCPAHVLCGLWELTPVFTLSRQVLQPLSYPPSP